MKRLISIFVFFSAGIIITFLLFSNLEETINSKLSHQQTIWSYSMLSFVFLVADILLPTPSSLIMILNGKMLGPAGGALLSLAASMIASAIGFYIGQKTAKGFNRFFSAKEIKLGNELFEKYGILSIAVSKGIPILSEAVSFLSGNTSIPFKKFLFYSLLGNLPVSIIYGYVGSYASTSNSWLISGLVIGLTLCIFFVFRFVLKRKVGSTGNVSN